MSSEIAEQVNRLITEKRYEEAKTLLRSSSADEDKRWLKTLEERFPAEGNVPSPKPVVNYGPYGMETDAPRRSPSTISSRAPERGGCLSAWLVFMGVVSVPTILLYLSEGSILGIISSAFTVTCVVGVWNWQKWGYFGLMASYIVAILLAVGVGSVASVIGSLIGLTITFALVNPLVDQMQ